MRSGSLQCVQTDTPTLLTSGRMTFSAPGTLNLPIFRAPPIRSAAAFDVKKELEALRLRRSRLNSLRSAVSGRRTAW